MRRRSSGSPIEDDSDDPAVSGAATEQGDGANHTIHISSTTSNQSSRVGRLQVTKDEDVADRRRDPASGASTPRSRTSFSWRASSQDPIVPGDRQSAKGMISAGPQRISMEPSWSDPLPRVRRSRLRSPWSCSLSILISTIVAAIFLLSILYSFVTRQIDPDGCGMPGMSPAYIKLQGFDNEHTRFASKYALYIYREQRIDEFDDHNIGLRGAPVLFLPGNAGSYKQVRSLASEASWQYHDVVQHDKEKLKAGARGLDFFMIDFNEDMAAFHGQTLLDQAEYVNEAIAYILSLYHDPSHSRRDERLPDPSSVILIGHSMGGIVARTVLTMVNYQQNSVNTIVTMSAPHARPPVSFDSDIVHTYKQINDYWREAYSQKWANNNPLWHVTLISIAGGGRDTVVPSDYTSLSSLVPETHGFTVFTSTIPSVWTGVDHVAITWCDQFRKVIIRSLFDIMDVRRSSQTKPRAERMGIFKKWYLTGLEDVAEKTLPQKDPNTLLTLEDDTNSILSQGERLVLRDFGKRKEPQAYLLPVPPQGVPGKKFTLLTDQSLDPSRGDGKLEVLFCTVYPLQSGQSASIFTMNMDLSGDRSGSTRLACKNAVEDTIYLPASTRQSKYAFDHRKPFSYLQYDLEDLAEHQFVAVVDKSDALSPGWVIAEFSDSSDSVIPTRVGLGRLLSAGLNVKLPANRPMLTEVKIPSLYSSLLAYKLKVGAQSSGNEPELFAPMIRQHMEDPHESKYFVNVREADINLHGIAPFMPPPLRENAALSGVSFQLWSDPSCRAPMNLSLSVDIPGSLGKLVMRYRTVFAAFPLLVVALVLRKQFKVYDETGIFITFTESLALCLRSSLPVSFVALSLLASSLATTRPVIYSDDFTRLRFNSTGTAVDFRRNDLLLGSQDAFFWFLVPIFGVISIGTCVIVNYAAMVIIYIFSTIYGVLVTRTGYIKHDERRNIPGFSPSTPKRRVINTVLLLILVATVIPYQFAYMVACIVQLATCVRAVWYSGETRSNTHYNFSNYAHSIFIIMLWVLPINILVLVVWVHNLAVHWLTPFSSHHNVLSIMPFILLVETLTGGNMIPRVTTRFKHITSLLLFLLAMYAAIYGVTYAYVLHHLVNVVAAWLVGIHFSTSGFTLGTLNRMLEGEELSPESSTTVSGISGGGHVKKMP